MSLVEPYIPRVNADDEIILVLPARPFNSRGDAEILLPDGTHAGAPVSGPRSIIDRTEPYTARIPEETQERLDLERERYHGDVKFKRYERVQPEHTRERLNKIT